MCGNQSMAKVESHRHSELMAPHDMHRKSFAEAMSLLPLPDSDSPIKRLVAEQPAWFPGKGLFWEQTTVTGVAQRRAGKGVSAAGIHVYAQAPLAAARVVENEERRDGKAKNGGRIGIHVSHRQSLAKHSLTDKYSPFKASSPTQGW